MIDLKNKIVTCLKENGADIVGFSSIERFTNKKLQKIFPQTKTIIGIAFRVLRGSHRGTEEGTTYYQYSTTGLQTLEETVMPMAMLKTCGILEDHGFAALPQKRNLTIMSKSESTNPEVDYVEVYRGISSEHQLDFEESAVMCGLGELGLHGTLLTDEFGPFQRYCFILTDAGLAESPIIKPHLCDNCRKCIDACPGKAISAAGRKDPWQCAAYYKGANMSKNPFMPPEAFVDDPDRLAIITGNTELSPEKAREVLDQIIFYPPIKHGYVSCICGKACDTACYIHLEEKGSLLKKFKTPFRKRPEWKLPIIG